MKNNEQIASLIKGRQFDGVRYACLERLKENKLDSQAWAFLGEAMLGMKRGKMATLCYRRAFLLDPMATWIDGALRDAQAVGRGNDDNRVLKMLEYPSTTVAATIITKDSSRTISKCLRALQDAVDEVIVVDTGSTDDTISIVESLGIKVHSFKWDDDFSAARNYALSLASTEWAIAVDSDEILYESDIEAIHTFAGLINHVTTPIVAIMQMNQMGSTIQSRPMFRMSKVRPDIKWQYPIHEQLFCDSPTEQPTVYYAGIHFFHDGYDPSVIDIQQKAERNMRILSRILEKNPDDAQFLYYMGREFINLKKFEQAIPLLEKSLSISFTANNAISLFDAYTASGNHIDALTVAHKLIQHLPDHPNGWFLYVVAMINQHTVKRDQAIEYLQRAKHLAQTYRGLEYFDQLIGLWKADLAMSEVALLSGDIQHAYGIINTILQEYPNLQPAIVQLQKIQSLASPRT